MRQALLTLALFALGQFAVAQTWIQRTSLPADGRHRATGISIGNRGYIGLGHVNGLTGSINYADWWEYDPGSDSWSQKANYPVQNYGAVAFSAGGKGYVGGGAALNGQFYCFNTQTNAWTATAVCPVSPGDQGGFSVNGKGYVISTGSLYEYNPVSDAWTQKQNPPVTFAMWCVAFSVGASGFVKDGSMLYEYKPLNDQWVARANFPGLNTNGGAAMIHNNCAYIVSGYVGSLNWVTPQVWKYHPGNNAWTQIGDFPGTSRRFSVAFTINNRGFFGTGTNGINFNDFWEMTDAVGVAEPAEETVHVNAFPNPAVEQITFQLNLPAEENNYAISLFNVTGALVRNEQFTGDTYTLYREDLPAGVYTYSILNNDGQVACGKLIFR